MPFFIFCLDSVYKKEKQGIGEILCFSKQRPIGRTAFATLGDNGVLILPDSDIRQKSYTTETTYSVYPIISFSSTEIFLKHTGYLGKCVRCLTNAHRNIETFYRMCQRTKRNDIHTACRYLTNVFLCNVSRCL